MSRRLAMEPAQAGSCSFADGESTRSRASRRARRRLPDQQPPRRARDGRLHHDLGYKRR